MFKFTIIPNTKKDKIDELTHSRFGFKTLDFIFSFPVFTSSQFIKGSRIPKRSAMRILGELKKGNVIKVIEEGAGKRPTTYVFVKLLNIVS